MGNHIVAAKPRYRVTVQFYDDAEVEVEAPNEEQVQEAYEKYATGMKMKPSSLGRVDGFDQDEAESMRDERAVILRGLLASKCDTLEALELADRLFDACPCLVECFRKEGRHILGVGSIRDCRTYSALAGTCRGRISVISKALFYAASRLMVSVVT
jgi:hypothetical protein